MDTSNSTHLNLKDVVKNFFRNTDIHLQDYMVSEPRTSKSKIIFLLKGFYRLEYSLVRWKSTDVSEEYVAFNFMVKE
jgi:hypothetical protein